MPEVPPLPPLHRAELDAATLDRLFADLADHAEVLGVTLKATAGRYADDPAVPLRAAYEALVQRTARGAQIRYRWQADTWCDTILCTSTGWRIVRLKEDQIA